ncbi:MAG: zinc-dependent alcohol dehydrogenase family protein [Planctomycetaceae bacterium]|nr:zinc-dependent alcohol dehydrogenase family protein [Planctomycetaceae bacterium]
MLAARFTQCGSPSQVLAIEDRPTPIPEDGEVRVRMLASPINPSDLLYIQGIYGQEPALPATPGFEGVGVVETGDGLFGRLLVGRRVCVLNRAGGNWAEQVVLPARQVIPLSSRLPIEQAATFFVNPMSAVAMVEEIHKVRRGEWLLQGAAGSSLGRMIIRLGRASGFRTCNVVRRPEQVDELRALGADEVVVFDATKQDPAQLVTEVRRRTGGTRCAIDPVGGVVGSAFTDCLTERGRLLVYGSLTELPICASPRTLIPSRISIEGFWLGPWMLGQSLPHRLRLVRRVSRLIQQGVLASDISESFPLTEIRRAVEAAVEPHRDGKILLRMDQPRSC